VGFLLAPTVRRTWAPRGQTPILYQRTRCTRKISSIGGLSLSPGRRHLGLYLHWYPDTNICQEHVIAFLRDLLRHLRGAVVVVWDRIQIHRSGAVRDWLARQRRLTVECLPAYAPELNPIEHTWSYLKYHRMPNHGIREVDTLGRRVTRETRFVRGSQRLLRSFIHGSELPIRLE
jgi:hypothetical protein